MNQRRWILFVVVFAVAVAAGFLIFRAVGNGFGPDAVEVDWRQLGDLDYVTGNATADLKALDGKMVKIPGFMVPLEDSQKEVTQFLLVPSPQACIHVPPPPPNQMVLVDMQKGGTPTAFGPIWVYGILHLHSKKHMYGESSFQMSGVAIEPYQ